MTNGANDTNDTNDTNDDDKVREITGQLAPVDVDSVSAERIARVARQEVGRRPSRRPIVEAVLVGILVTGFFVWAFLKALSIFG
jgi:hypothetical protein